MLMAPLAALADDVPYAVYVQTETDPSDNENPERGTLTLYYGEKPSEGTVFDVTSSNHPGWFSKRENISKVVFDASFANARPTTCSSWFSGAEHLSDIDGLEYLNTSEVTNMYGMFWGCKSLTSLDLSSFNTSKVEGMNYMFYECSNLTTLDISKIDTKEVTSMSHMFGGCSKLATLTLPDKFNTEKVTNMEYLFSYVYALPQNDFQTFASKLNTANVTNMQGMFYYCQQLTTLDLSNFNTANVTNMKAMFTSCSKLQAISLDNFNTMKVTDMSWMFNSCYELTELNLFNFDTNAVTDMSSMFSYCEKLVHIYCADTWNAATTSTNMFQGCTILLGSNTDHVDASYAKPDGDGGYFEKPVRLGTSADGAYWCTYYTDTRNVKPDENTTVYKAKLNDNKLALTKIDGNIIPVGQAVILKSESANGTIYLYTVASADVTDAVTDQYADNDLRGTQRSLATSDVSGQVYTLAKVEDVLGFYKFTGSNLAAEKAYVVSTSGARAITFEGDETTDINAAPQQGSEAAGAVYDMQGRRVEHPVKGLYIVNGKKTVKL